MKGYLFERVENYSNIHFTLNGHPLYTSRRAISATANQDGTLGDEAFLQMMEAMQLTANVLDTPVQREPIEYKLNFDPNSNMWILECIL